MYIKHVFLRKQKTLIFRLFLLHHVRAEAPNLNVVDILQDRTTDSDVWAGAVKSVILYLRGMRILNVLREIRSVLPMDR